MREKHDTINVNLDTEPGQSFVPLRTALFYLMKKKDKKDATSKSKRSFEAVISANNAADFSVF